MRPLTPSETIKAGDFFYISGAGTGLGGWIKLRPSPGGKMIGNTIADIKQMNKWDHPTTTFYPIIIVRPSWLDRLLGREPKPKGRNRWDKARRG